MAAPKLEELVVCWSKDYISKKDKQRGVKPMPTPNFPAAEACKQWAPTLRKCHFSRTWDGYSEACDAAVAAGNRAAEVTIASMVAPLPTSSVLSSGAIAGILKRFFF